MPSTIVLGFDALDFRYLDRFADSLPNFAALRSAGVEAPLRSTYPPWTGSAWPSMYTGVDPSHHGVYSFFDWQDHFYPDDTELITRDRVRAPAIWNYLTARGRSSVVCNVPVTHPADEIDGALVPGYLAPETAPGYPDGIREEISRNIGEDYRIYSDEELADDGQRLDDYVDLVHLRRRAGEYLLETYEPDFAFIQVQKTDAVFHNYDDPAAFKRLYEAADRLLGSVREMAAASRDPVDVIVCSDHGIGPTTGYKVNLNEILHERGFVESGTADGTPSSLMTEKETLVDGAESTDGAGEEGGSLLRAGTSTLSDGLRAVGVGPGRIYSLLDRLGVASHLVSVTPPGMIDAMAKDIDWRASQAYCRGTTELGIRINLEGREPQGAVPEADYEALRTTLIDLLSDLRTPEGDPVFEFVVPREELYDGPYTEHAPDVCCKPAGMNHVIGRKLVGNRFVGVDSHDHKSEGVFFGAGPSFDPDARLDHLSLVDVAPIAMASMDLPVPETMTGSVPDGLLETAVRRTAYEVERETREQGIEDGEDAVTDRLSDLGYL